jgi:hypothetical protein
MMNKSGFMDIFMVNLFFNTLIYGYINVIVYLINIVFH